MATPLRRVGTTKGRMTLELLRVLDIHSNVLRTLLIHDPYVADPFRGSSSCFFLVHGRVELRVWSSHLHRRRLHMRRVQIRQPVAS